MGARRDDDGPTRPAGDGRAGGRCRDQGALMRVTPLRVRT